MSDAPVVAAPIPDQSSPEDAPWSYTLPAGTFSDADGQPLTLTATLDTGAALPDWLSFNAATRTFSSTPPANFFFSIDLRVTASDGALSVSDTFTLTITPVNDAPVVAVPIPDQSSPEDTAWSYTLAAGSFTDAEGQPLTLTAALANGAALPAWLSFNAATRTLSGTPPANFNGSLDIRVTASDGAASVSDTFVLAITPVNDAPTVPADTTLTVAEDALATPLGLAAPTDPDTEVLTITVIALPDPTIGRVVLADGVTALSVGASLTPDSLAGLLFIASPDAFGEAGAFGYSVSDGTTTLLRQVTIDVTPVPDSTRPSAGPDTIIGTDGAETIDALGGNDSVLGLGGADRLVGGADADTLDGGGGADTMRGGTENDLFFVDTATDRVIEALNEGADTVIASVNHVLANHVEALQLAGAARSGTGNNQANRLTGTDFADTLYGLAGADTMEGGQGDDTYRADALDLLLEAPGGGTDRVIALNSFSLVTFAEIETLALTGTVAANGTGNAGNNLITGNAMANRLDGNEGNDSLSGGDGNDTLRGGAGADSLFGGTGLDLLQGGDNDDVYLVTDGGATVSEALNAGLDLVNATVSFVLGNNIENLTLLGGSAIDGTGNGLANVIAGNGAANVLDGAGGADSLSGGNGNDTLLGGAGADTLTGGGGGDTFRYDRASEGTDRITDYSVAADSIAISAAGFGLNIANPVNFIANTTGLASAAAGTPQFIYRTDTVTLLFDADGQGGAAAQPLLTFATAPAGFGASEIVLF